MRSLASILKVLGGISIGVGIGQQWARVELDRYYRQKGEEFVSAQYRAMQSAMMARDEPSETPAATEEDLDGPDTSDDVIVVGGTAILEEQLSRLDPVQYAQTASEYGTPQMVEQAITYITEDDYNEDGDGFAKEQITVFMQAGNEPPVFVNGGDTIDNWSDLIGDTVLVDFFRLFPPNETERVLYIRNHERGEDYEVFQAMG